MIEENKPFEIYKDTLISLDLEKKRFDTTNLSGVLNNYHKMLSKIGDSAIGLSSVPSRKIILAADVKEIKDEMGVHYSFLLPYVKELQNWLNRVHGAALSSQIHNNVKNEVNQIRLIDYVVHYLLDTLPDLYKAIEQINTNSREHGLSRVGGVLYEIVDPNDFVSAIESTYLDSKKELLGTVKTLWEDYVFPSERLKAYNAKY